MIKAVLFDFGGTVKAPEHCLDDIAFTYGVSRKIIMQRTQPLISLFSRGLITENNFWKENSGVLRKPIPKNKKDLWRKCYKETFYVYPKLMNFVKSIRARGIKTAVLSNTIKPHAEISAKKGGYKNFDVVVLSYKVHLRKPDPKIYRLTVKRLGVKSEECIFVDDKYDYLKPAKKLGIKTILAKNQRQIIRDISRVLDSFNRF